MVPVQEMVLLQLLTKLVEQNNNHDSIDQLNLDILNSIVVRLDTITALLTELAVSLAGIVTLNA